MALSEQDRRWLQRTAPGAVRFDEPMARHTTLRVGGPAEALVRPRDVAQLRELVSGAAQRGLPLLVLGRGSNLLVTDGGIEGMVIELSALHTITLREAPEPGGTRSVTALAGARLAALCRFALSRGLAGLEFAVGIPGSVGGAVAVNAGTADGSMGDVLTSVTVMTPGGDLHRLSADRLSFGYRRFALPPELAEDGSGRRAVIVSGAFRLRPSDPARIRSRARRLARTRLRKQPLARPSAGSFFKNPPGREPAGRLIEAAGLKGRRVGDAAVSRRHANFIVNLGRATSSDVLALADQVQREVQARFGVRLEPEVVIVGRGRRVVS